NFSTNAVTYQWTITNTLDNPILTNTNKNPVITFTKEGTYTVRLLVTNIHGCSDSITFIDYLSVIAGGVVNVPNAFTPNNDLINDKLKPVGFGLIQKNYSFMGF